jgi:hypothetical protein
MLAVVFKDICVYYRKIERVSSYNLMRVRGRCLTRIDKRISSFDSELRACKPKHVLRRDRLPQECTDGESVPEHGEILCV